MSDVTRILSEIESGDPTASEKLLPLVYEELRKLAATRLSDEQPGQTLQATALVHEAYVRLVDVERAEHWNSRGHFFSAAAQAMRRILVETARRKQSLKHGGDLHRQSADIWNKSRASASVDLVSLDESLHQLATDQPQIAKLVELKYFGGLTIEEAAVALEISPRTAHRYWTYAKAWLLDSLTDDPPN